ncbi:hypothetical protein MMC27_001088 [Xylographa pallens]|nr:hypothetical protein [Xylographa pallens]
MAVPSLPSTMIAAQVVEFNKPYRIHSIPTPSPSSIHAYDLIVRIAVASLCHTDSMVARGSFHSHLPITGSHEGAGTVVAIGSAVTNFSLGDRVMCGIKTHRCMECRTCRGPEEYRNYCPNNDGDLGIRRDGAFAEYAVCDARESNRLPDGVDFELAAPLACAGRTIFRAVKRARLEKGQWLGLVGSGGGLGHLGIQFAKALGLKVVGIDARDEGLALSREYGADEVIDVRKGKEAVVQEVMRATEGMGCHATVNLSDAASAAETACAVTMMHGRMIQIAQPDRVSVPMEEFIFRDIHVEGSLLCTVQQGQEMLEVVAKNGITVKTNMFYGLEQLPELVESAHSGRMQGKGLIIVDEEAVKKEQEETS